MKRCSASLRRFPIKFGPSSQGQRRNDGSRDCVRDGCQLEPSLSACICRSDSEFLTWNGTTGKVVSALNARSQNRSTVVRFNGNPTVRPTRVLILPEGFRITNPSLPTKDPNRSASTMSSYQHLYKNDSCIQRPPLLSHEMIKAEETGQEPTEKKKHHHRRGNPHHHHHKHHEQGEQHKEKHATTRRQEKTADSKRDSSKTSSPSELVDERTGRHAGNVAAQNVAKKQASSIAPTSMKHMAPIHEDSDYANAKKDNTRNSTYPTDPSGCLDSNPMAREAPLEEDKVEESSFAAVVSNQTYPGAIAVPGPG